MTPQTTGPVAAEMLRRLNSALSPTSIELVDESEQHRGHGGYNPQGESHFKVRIESPAFAGKSRLDRHRMINQALAANLAGGVHALAIHADAPGEHTR